MPTTEAPINGMQTVAEAANYLSTSKRRVWDLLRCGELAGVRDGKFVKITTSELERYIRELPAYEPVSA